MSSITKATILITIGTLVSNILGFSREIILAYKYGTSSLSDIYIIASIIPSTIFASVATAIETSYIPIASEISTYNSKKFFYFTSNLLNIIGVLSVLITILLVIFAEPVVKVFAFGLQGEVLNQAVHLTKIMMPLILFLAFYNIFQGYLQINNKFFVTSLIGIPLNICFISGIIFSSPNDIWIMGVGNLLGYIVVFCFLLIFVYRTGFKYYLIFNLKDSYIKRLLYLTLPIFIGVSVNQLNTIVDRSFASTLGEGIISALNYSSRLIYFTNGLFVMSMVTAIFPRLSKLSVLNNREHFKQLLSSSIVCIIALMIPISVGTIVLAEPIVRILFERGSFDTTATEYTSSSLAYYSIGMAAIGMRELLSKVFYSIQDTRTPMINGMIAVALNVILNIVFVRYIGYTGLPLATSISSIFTVLLLILNLKIKIGSFGIRGISITTLKIMFSSIIMGFLVRLSYLYVYSLFHFNKLGDIVGLVISVFIGIFVYFILIYLLRINEIKILLFNVLRKNY